MSFKWSLFSLEDASIFFKSFFKFCFIGDAALEYSCLAFNTEQQLAGLSGVPDSKLTLWDWVKAVKLYSISTNIKVIVFEGQKKRQIKERERVSERERESV
jgi:hypothetical protein